MLVSSEPNATHLNGAVYVYDFSGGTWTQRGGAGAYIPLGGREHRYGSGITLSGDGVIAVVKCGANSPDNMMVTWDWSGSAWVERSYELLDPEESTSSSLWGFSSIALSSDGSVLAVGEEQFSGSGLASTSGVVYVYDWNLGLFWEERVRYQAADVDSGDRFGSSLAISADGETLAVGAVHDDDTQTASGAVYILDRNGSTWTDRSKIKADVPILNSYFGEGVSLRADASQVAVGDYTNDHFYTFEWTGSAWSQLGEFDVAGLTADKFGRGIAFEASSYNLVVAADAFDDVYTDEGRLFRVNTETFASNIGTVPAISLASYEVFTTDGTETSEGFAAIPSTSMTLTANALSAEIRNFAVNLPLTTMTLTANVPTTYLYEVHESAFTAQSSLNAYINTHESAFTAQSTLDAYQAQESKFTAQSAIDRYLAEQGVYTAQSELGAYQPQESTFTAQSALDIYLSAIASFTAQSVLEAYSEHESAFTAQSSIDIYRAQESAFTAQSNIDVFIEWIGTVTYQSALESYEPQQAEFIAQSAIKVYRAMIGVFVAQSKTEIYVSAESTFVAQSSIDAYTAQTADFVAQSELLVYLPQQGVFTAQSFLDAHETYYTFCTNVESKATTEYTNFNFNSLSKGLGASSSGIYALTGDTDAGTAITASLTSGKMDFGTSFLKRVSDAYIGAESDGTLSLTLTTDNGPVTYPLSGTSSMDTLKADLAKGSEGRYWQVDLSTAGSLELDSIELLPDVLSRRR
jgi:hypothetical protein